MVVWPQYHRNLRLSLDVDCYCRHYRSTVLQPRGRALRDLLRGACFYWLHAIATGSPEEVDTALRYRQAVITADGMRQALGNYGQLFWSLCLLVGLCVFLPSQMSIVENFSRRWTDII